MPTVSRTEVMELVGRVRRVWGPKSVEMASGSQDWLYRISCPDKWRIQIHKTPSDRNWKKSVEAELKAHGFLEDEAEWKEQETVRKKLRHEEMLERNKVALRETERRAKEENAVLRAAGPYVAKPADVDWIFTPHEFPETRRFLITPVLAEKILVELNSANRPLRKGRVAYWASIIRKDRWRFTHQGIAFDVNAVLQDGQHRLAAAVEEGFTLDVLVTVGMPSDNYGVVDVGAPRSGGDTLARLGKANYNHLNGAIRLVALYDKYGPEFRSGIKGRIPNDEIEELAEKYGQKLEDCIASASTLYFKHRRGGPKMSIVAGGAGLFLITRNLPEGLEDERVLEFIRGYSDGTNLFAGDARLPLRNYMTNLTDNRNRKVPVSDQLAVFLKAWNAWVQGDAVNVLGWRKNELMPTVVIPSVLVKRDEIPEKYREEMNNN